MSTLPGLPTNTKPVMWTVAAIIGTLAVMWLLGIFDPVHIPAASVQ